MKTIEQRAITVIAEGLGLPESDVTADKTFDEDYGADSLDKMELILIGIEDEFYISIADVDVKKLNSLRDVVELVARQENQRFRRG